MFSVGPIVLTAFVSSARSEDGAIVRFIPTLFARVSNGEIAFLTLGLCGSILTILRLRRSGSDRDIPRFVLFTTYGILMLCTLIVGSEKPTLSYAFASLLTTLVITYVAAVFLFIVTRSWEIEISGEEIAQTSAEETEDGALSILTRTGRNVADD